MVDLPTEVIFDATPYGIAAERPLFLMNDSDSPVGLTFVTDGPFSVSPTSVSLPPMMSKQLTLTCHPTNVGVNRGTLRVSLNKALYKSVALICSSYSAEFKLERTILDNFSKTLVTHTATSSVHLMNTSDVVTTFRVKAYPCPQNGEDPDFHELLLPFSIFPRSGTIYPSSKCNFTVTFQPSVSGPHDTTAWIECTGSKERQPLRMRALAVGPEVEFDCDELRFRSVVVGASARGELTLTNHSEVEVEFHLMPTEEHDPSYILQYSCISGVIPPKSHINIELTFTPHSIREYIISSLWSILGLNKCLVVEIKATSIAPNVEMKVFSDSLTETHLRVMIADKRLRRRIVDEANGRRGVYYSDEHNDAEHMSWLTKEFLTVNEIDKDRIIDFDLVAFSFSSSKDLRVRNLSQLECDFTLKIEPSKWVIEHEGQGNSDSKQEMLLACSDFSVNPPHLRLKPGADAHVSLTILPKRRAGFYKDIDLNLYHASSPKPLQTIQIIGSIINPKFEIDPTVINITDGFVGYKHTFNVKIKNIASVIGKWSFPVQDILDNCLITCSKANGVLLPGAEESLECGIIPRSQGHLVIPVAFTSDAFEKQTLSCMVQYSAGGPRVEASGSLEFTRSNNKESYIRVLDVARLPLTLKNVGLTSARCRIIPEKHGSFFSVEKEFSDKLVAPGEETSVPITFYTTEAGTYRENLLVYVTLANASCSLSEDTIKATSSVIKVPMYASAKGTNLFCPDQDLNKDPNVNCGTWFVTEELQYSIVIQNHGAFAQNCTWVYIGNPGIKKGQGNTNYLKFEQDRAQLQPGAFHTFKLKGRAPSVINNGREIYQLKSNVPGKETKVAFQVTFCYSFINAEVAASELLIPLNEEMQTIAPYHERCDPIPLGKYSFIERHLILACRGQSSSAALPMQAARRPIESSLTIADVSETVTASVADGPSTRFSTKKQRLSLLNFIYEEFPVIASPDYFFERADSSSQFLGAGNIPLNNNPPVPLIRFVAPDGDYYVRHELTKFLKLVNTSTLPGRMQILVQAPFQVRVIAKEDENVCHYIHDTLALETGLVDQIDNPDYGGNFISATIDNSPSPRNVEHDLDDPRDESNAMIDTSSHAVDELDDDTQATVPANVSSPFRQMPGVQKGVPEESEIPIQPNELCPIDFSDPLHFPAFSQTVSVDLKGNSEEFCIIEISVDTDYVRSDFIPKFIDSALIIRLLPPGQLPISVPTVTVPMKLSAFFPSLEFRSCSLATLEEYNLDIYSAYSALSSMQSKRDSLLDNSSADSEKGVIDFGMANVGTTITQIILCKNISRFPIRFQWLLQMAQGSDKFKYDITPLGVDGNSGLLPGNLAKFSVSFVGQTNEISTDQCKMICSIDGGESYSYGLRAGTSNLEADVRPSHINYGDIAFSSEQSSTITITNKSPMKTTIIISIPYECRPFITRINNTPLQVLTSPTAVSDFNYELSGHSVLEIPLNIRPLVPGPLYVPLSIKIGYLERLILPITAKAYIERPILVSGGSILTGVHTQMLNTLPHTAYLFPWDNNASASPLSELLPYNAFLLAASLYVRCVETDAVSLRCLAEESASSEANATSQNIQSRPDCSSQLISTLHKKIGSDGSLEIYGTRYEPKGAETLENEDFISSLRKDYIISSVASDLCINFLEFYRYYGSFPIIGTEDIIEVASRSAHSSARPSEKKMSIARTRLLSPSVTHRISIANQTRSETPGTNAFLDSTSVVSQASSTRAHGSSKQPMHLNDSQYHHLREKTSTNYLCSKYILFNVSVSLPPVIRGSKTSQTITICNKGSTPMHLSFDKRFMLPAGASMEPEKVSRLPSGESISLTIMYTASHKATLGDYVFIIPVEFKQSIIGFLTCTVLVTLPTIRPVNLSACSSNFVTLPIKESDAYILNFGEVLYGQAKMFNLRLENPTAVQTSYTFEILSGVVGTLNTDKKKPLSVEAPLIGTDPNIFTVVAPEDTSFQNYGSLAPKASDLLLDIVFKPFDYFPDTVHQTYFRGSLVFQIKMGGANGNASKVTIHFVGLGYHPLVHLNKQIVEFLPIYPKELPGSLEIVELRNDSDETYELYLKEFDKFNHVEQLLYSSVARNYGKTLISDRKTTIQHATRAPDGTQGDPSNNSIYRFAGSYTPAAFSSNSPAVLSLLGKQDVLSLLAATEQSANESMEPTPSLTEARPRRPVKILSVLEDKQARPTTYSHLLREIPAPGDGLGPITKKLLLDLGLSRLVAWFDQFYLSPEAANADEPDGPVEKTIEKSRGASANSDKRGTAQRTSSAASIDTQRTSRDVASAAKSEIVDKSVNLSAPKIGKCELPAEDETMQYLDMPVSQDDFAYDLCPIELLTQKYARVAPSVIKGRSYRIASNDTCLSNLPFLVYIIHGAPLAGKTSLAHKISSFYNKPKGAVDALSNDIQVPILSLEQLLENSKVYKDVLVKVSQWEDATKKPPESSGKNVPKKKVEETAPAVDPMKEPEYIDALAESLYTSILEKFGMRTTSIDGVAEDESTISYTHNLTGLIFDSLTCSAVRDAGDALMVIAKASVKHFMKPIFYAAQSISSRLLLHTIILDCSPVDSRRRAMEIIVNDYKSAEMGLPVQDETESAGAQKAESKLALVRFALSGAKKQYDREFALFSKEVGEVCPSPERQIPALSESDLSPATNTNTVGAANAVEQKPEESAVEYIAPAYSTVFVVDDPHGAAHQVYLKSVPLINSALRAVKELITLSHKAGIDSYRASSGSSDSFSPEELSYRKALDTLKQAQDALSQAKKADQKRLQQAVDEAAQAVAELEKTLPPHPVNKINDENMFIVTYIDSNASNKINPISILEEILLRVRKAYTCYTSVLQKKLTNLATYSSVRSISGQGTFTSFLHVQTSDDLYVIETMQRILDVIFDAADYKHDSFSGAAGDESDTPDPERTVAAADTTVGTESIALAADSMDVTDRKKPRTSKTPVQVLNKMLQKYVRSPAFATLKHVTGAIMNKEFMSPRLMLECLYDVAVFQDEQEKTFKRLARVLPANSSAISSLQEAREKLQTVGAEIKDLQASLSSKGANSKQLSQQLAEKQAEKEHAETSIRTLFSGADMPNETGPTRWILKPRSSIRVGFRFISNSILTTKLRVHVGVRGCSTVFPLVFVCKCDFPHIIERLNVMFTARAATKTGKTLMPLPEGTATVPLTASGTQHGTAGVEESSAAAEVSQTPNVNESGQVGELPAATTQQLADASIKLRPGEPIAIFGFGHLRSGLHRPEFFSTNSAFSNPYSASEAPLDSAQGVKPRASTKARQSRPSSSASVTVLPNEEEHEQGNRTESASACILTKLSTLTHQRACKFIADTVCKFTPHHIEVLSIINDSYFPTTVAFVFDSMLHGFAELMHASSNKDGEVDFSSDETISIVKEGLQKVFLSADPNTSLQELLSDGALQASKGGTKQPGKPGVKGAPAANVDPVFFIHPHRLTLQPGERSAVYLTCFPPEDKSYRETLFIGVDGNPGYLAIGLTCTGQTPRIEYSLPECAEDLIPCSTISKDVDDLAANSIKYLANGYRLDAKEIISGSKNASKAPAKGKDLPQESIYQLNNLLVPRVPTNTTESLEIPIENTSQLPLMVEYSPMHKDLSMLTAITQIVNYPEYVVKQAIKTTKYPKSTRIADQQYSWKINNALLLNNSRFYLGPGEKKVLSIEYSNSTEARVVMPGKLLVRQHVGGLKNVPENDVIIDKSKTGGSRLPTLDALGKAFLNPVVEHTLNVVCESHKVDVFATIVGISESPDRIPSAVQGGDSAFDITKPNNNLNLGIVRALVYFKAELMLVNNGPYQVGYRVVVSKNFKDVIFLVEDSDSREKTDRGKKQDQPAAAQARPIDPDMYKLSMAQSGTLGVDEANRPSSRPNAPQKPIKGSSDTQASKIKIGLIFRAPEARIYEKVPILQVTFFEPLTNLKLARSNINLTAEAVFSQAKIQPERNVVFGEHPHGKVVSKTISIRNEGHFPFLFYIEPLEQVIKRWLLFGTASSFDDQAKKAANFELDTSTLRQFGVNLETAHELYKLCVDNGLIRPSTEQKTQPRAAEKKGAANTAINLASIVTLHSGPFIIQPSLLQLAPQESKDVTVTFTSQANGNWRDYFVVDYTNKPPDYFGGSALAEAFLASLLASISDSTKSAPSALQNYISKNEDVQKRLAKLQYYATNLPLLRYSLSAVSIIPGIVTSNYSNIFEEQALSNQLPANPSMLLGGPTFSPISKTFCLGPCVIGSELSERIKITNPYSVPCTVVVLLNFDPARMTPQALDGVISEHCGETSTQIVNFVSTNMKKSGKKDAASVSRESRERSSQQATKPPKPSGDKKDATVVTNDNEAWSLDNDFFRLLPNESTYVTIKYSPSAQVVSRCQLICVVVDHHFAVADLIKNNLPGVFGLAQSQVSGAKQPAGKGAPPQDHIVLQQLEDGLQEQDVARRRLSFIIEATGVLPEVSFSPQFVNLGKVTVGSSEADLPTQHISILNTGRVNASYAIVISAQDMQHADCFVILQSQGRGSPDPVVEDGEEIHIKEPAPQGRLFTGLVVLPASTKNYFAIAPDTTALARFSNGEVITATLSIKVMTSSVDYTVAEIPLQCTSISSKLNAIEGRFIGPAMQNMYREATALLFGTLGNQKAEPLIETILSHLADSKAYEQLRQNEILMYGDMHLNPAVSNRSNVYLKDLPLNLVVPEDERPSDISMQLTEPSNTRPKSRPSQSSSMSVNPPQSIPQYMTVLNSAIYNTEVILQNTSTNHIRFEFNADLCRKLGVLVHPSIGHIHAGTKKTIIVRLTCPGGADEFAALFNAPGGKAAPPKAKKAPSKYGQTVLFGTPLICRYYPIMFQPGRRVNDWDNAQTTVSYVTNASGVAVRTETVCPEPEYQVYLDEDEIRSLLEEMVSSREPADALPRAGKGQSQASAKTAPPAGRQALLQRVLSDVHAPDNRAALASGFLELDLFGFAGDFSVKCFSSSQTGDLEPLTPKAGGTNEHSCLEFPMVSTPILQKSNASFYLLNDSQTSPVVMFNSIATSQPESPYFVEPALDGKAEVAIIPARPDTLASLIREYYPTLLEIPSISGIMAKLGIGAKTQIDKNTLSAFQAALTSTNPSTNRYLVRYNVSYEPRFPGAHHETFNSTAGNLSLSLSSTAILPVCHLECNSNNVYLQTMRPGSMKTPQLFANLICSNPKSVKVLEIVGQGVGITITNHITVLNCINQPYDVTLQRLPESNSTIVSTFGAGGRVSPGETSIIRFDYTPTRESTRAGVEEGFFIIRIPQHDVTLPLLVVGRPTEPEVILSTNKLSFNPILVGDCATKEVTLTNTEKYPMNYKIRLAQPAKNMVDDDSANASFQCTITPTAGILQPLSATSILFTIKPTCEGRVNQLIKIVIPRRSVPLSLNVKYESFTAKHLLELLPDTPVGLPHQLGSHSELNFETVFVSDYRSRTLKLSNVGSHEIGYTCVLALKRQNSTARRDEVEFKRAKSCIEYEIETSDGDKEVNVTSKQTIKPGDHVFIALKFQPVLELRLTKDFGLTFTISVEGCGSQEIQLLGVGLKPGLHTETTRLDYGAALNSLRHDKYVPKIISFVNRDTQPLTMEYFIGTNDFFIDTPPLSEPLRVGKTHDVAVKFIPNYAGRFKDVLTVMVNGLYKLRYPLTGQGIDCSFALHDVMNGTLINSYSNLSTSHALTVVNLGSTSLSSPPIIKALNIKNTTGAIMHARVAINDASSDEVPKGLFLAIVPTEQYHDYFNKCMDMLDNWSNRNTKQVYLAGLPKECEMLPSQLCTVMVMHSPISRTPQFQVLASVSIEDSVLFDSIISIKGAVLGSSAKLINQNIEMPPCIINSFVSRNFFIENTGDTELRYGISVPPKGLVKKSLLELFEKGVITISPVSGLIPVGASATVTVKFSPQQVCRHYIPSIPVECTMEGKMVVVGEATLRCICLDKKAMEAGPSAQEVHMSCNARESTFTMLHVDNNTDSVFVVRSILDGPDARQFQVPERLSIPPGGMDFKVMYNPLATADLHRADLYIAGADGGASIWALHGTVAQPMDEAVVTNMQEADYNDLIGRSGASVAIVGKDKGKQTPAPGAQGLPQSFVETLTKVQKTICTGVEAVCYRYTTFSFPLRNWEKRMQRFTVDIQFLDPSLSTFCQLSYPEIIDAPAIGAIRNVELGFMPFVSGKLFAGTLSFVAHETNEKLVYRFIFESGGAPTVGRAALETTVRDPVEKLITIPNPLLSNKAVSSLTLTAMNDRDDLTITPETVTFNNKTSTYSFKVKFNPYIPFDSGVTNARVSFGVSTILSGVEKSELCKVCYTLELMCYIPRPSSPMKVQADVGTTLPFTVTLVNNLKPKPAEKIMYALGLTEMHDVAGINELISKKTATGAAPAKAKESVSGIIDGKAIQNSVACFGLASSDVTASYGQPFTISLKFSPQSFGEYSASLVVYNKQGGFWVVPLIGKCTRPPASGTITVTK